MGNDDFIEVNELRADLEEETPLVPMEYENSCNGKVFAALFLGIAIGMLLTFGYIMTIQECISNETLINQTQESFLYGVNYGMEYTVIRILNETTKCDKPFPIEYQNETYNIFLVECLQGGAQ